MAEEVSAMASSIGSSLIPIINKLQDIFTTSGGDLPQISLPHVAVVICQSSGRSSVLEALIGRDLLPRGTEIYTRRPLMLMLQNRPPRADTDDAWEWGEFRHLPGKQFYNFSKIRQDIQTHINSYITHSRGVSSEGASPQVTQGSFSVTFFYYQAFGKAVLGEVSTRNLSVEIDITPERITMAVPEASG